MKIEYTYIDNGIVNVLVCKPSENKKLGIMSIILSTYHFGIDQVIDADLKNDAASCLDCPLSYTNNGGKGKCYTHKGFQLMGLRGMLKRLSREFREGKIKPFDMTAYNNFTQSLPSAISLVRFGSYGEPVLLDIRIVSDLVKLGKSYVGYSHQWNKPQYQEYSKYYMASTHNAFEVSIANEMGWRAFNVGQLDGAVGCPAAKENGRKTACDKCSLCGGTEGKSTKNITILKH